MRNIRREGMDKIKLDENKEFQKMNHFKILKVQSLTDKFVEKMIIYLLKRKKIS